MHIFRNYSCSSSICFITICVYQFMLKVVTTKLSTGKGKNLGAVDSKKFGLFRAIYDIFCPELMVAFILLI